MNRPLSHRSIATARRALAVLSFAALPLILAACGNKGPLILPPREIPMSVPGEPASASQRIGPEEIGDPSEVLDETPKADDDNAADDNPADDRDDDVDPPETGDTPVPDDGARG